MTPHKCRIFMDQINNFSIYSSEAITQDEEYAFSELIFPSDCTPFSSTQELHYSAH